MRYLLCYQVYQARLCSNGEVVAVKVQRPGVQAAISLDIFILRYLAGLIRRLGKFNTDLQVFSIMSVMLFASFLSLFMMITLKHSWFGAYTKNNFPFAADVGIFNFTCRLLLMNGHPVFFGFVV